MNPVAFMTANDIARATGWSMRDWGHGDRATQDLFAPLETYERRLDELLGRIRRLGFDAVDLWGAHLGTEWATDAHVEVARRVLGRHGLRVASYATWVGPGNVERACELARAVGTRLIGGGISGDPAVLAAVLRRHGVALGIENHPEATPAEVLAKIEPGADVLGATVDTGWWVTQGYDAVAAIDELGEHVLHVHLKDIRSPDGHETCAWGEGCVPIEACVRALRRLGYTGALSVEHEPPDEDPTEACGAMLAQARAWLA